MKNAVPTHKKGWIAWLGLRFSLLLMLATVLLWVRSNYHGDVLQVGRSRVDGQELKVWRMGLSSGQGGVRAFFTRRIIRDADSIQDYRAGAGGNGAIGWSQRDPPNYPMPIGGDNNPLSALGIMGRDYAGETPWGYVHTISLTLPLWVIFVAAGAWPLNIYIRSVLQHQREERLLLGLCPYCGVLPPAGSTTCPACTRRLPAIVGGSGL